jgi:hypothetical protein
VEVVSSERGVPASGKQTVDGGCRPPLYKMDKSLQQGWDAYLIRQEMADLAVPDIDALPFRTSVKTLAREEATERLWDFLTTYEYEEVV